MVDWSLARQLARLAANAGSSPPPLPDADFPALVAESERHLTDYTGLAPQGGIPAAETVGRAEWAEVNVAAPATLRAPAPARRGGLLGGAARSAGPLRRAGGPPVAA